jgi:hypothetical protein
MKKMMAVFAIILIYLGLTITYHPITRWFFDGRQKNITYFHTTFMFTHIEIEVMEPEMRESCAVFESMNIYIFSETYHLHHVISWRYINFIET